MISLAITFVGLSSPMVRGNEIPISPAANVDERLFLTYVVHHLYSSLPTELSEPRTVQQQLSAVRDKAARFQQYAAGRNLDPQLTELFTDCLAAVDAYGVLLEKLGRIERGAVAQEQSDRVGTGTTAILSGGASAFENYDSGGSGAESVLAGLAVGAIEWFVEDYQKGQARDEAKLAAMQAAGRELDAKLTAIAARLKNSESEMVSRYGWGSNEIRSAASEQNRLAQYVADDDLVGVLQTLDRVGVRRPRDAFILVSRDMLSCLDEQATPKSLEAAAKACVQRATLIPSGQIYDPFRAEFLDSAASIANAAWEQELTGKSWAQANNATAAYAVNLWDTVLKYAPADETGECREERAWALMASGRIEESHRQAYEVVKLRGETIRFAINFARVLSAAGQTDASFVSFRYAVKNLGYNAILEAKADPDLAAMRQTKAEEFLALTTVAVTWGYRPGIFNDDIVATNNSAFALTNVTFDCRIEYGGKVWMQELKCETIMPGETYKWTNVLSIPGHSCPAISRTVSIG